MLSRFNHVCLLATLRTIACQAPLSRQDYWSNLALLQGIFLTQRSNPALAGGFSTTSATLGSPFETHFCLLRTLHGALFLT